MTGPTSTSINTMAPSLRLGWDALGQHVVELGFRVIRIANRDGAIERGGTADSQQRIDRGRLIDMSRAFMRDNVIYQSVVNRMIGAINGPDGFRPEARTRSKALNARIEILWNEWAKNPETRGMHDWASLQEVVAKDVMVAGDIGAIKVRGTETRPGQLQLQEAELITDHRSSSEALEQGIELDPLGKPIAYRISDPDRLSGQPRQTSRRISADDFIFVANLERITQTRGVPALTPGFAILHRIMDILDAETAAWQLMSRFGLTINQADAGAIAGGFTAEDTTKEASDGDITDRITQIEFATIFHANPGESIEGINQNRPSQNFEQSIRVFLRLLTMPIGMPLEVLLNDYAGMNFSTAKAALGQFNGTVRRWQRSLIRQFHSRVYRWKVTEWIRRGLLPADRKDILNHEWILPAVMTVDPEKEVAAKGEKLDRGLLTHKEALLDDNKDRTEQMNVREAEVDDAMAHADRVNKKHPNQFVSWHMFAGVEQGKTEAAFNQLTQDSQEPSPVAPAQEPVNAE